MTITIVQIVSENQG